MFKLIKLIIGLVGLGVFVWWGLTVPLGERTLFEHVAAIGKSRESQQLVQGTKEKVDDLKKKIGASNPATAKAPAAPQERLSNADRKEMRHLIDSRAQVANAKVAKGTN